MLAGGLVVRDECRRPSGRRTSRASMAIAYALDHERRRVYTHAHGLLTYAELSTHFNAKMRDERAGWDELFDATAVDTDLTAEQVRSLFLHVLPMLEKGLVGATGIVATN